jgi:hypothetical protein
MATDYMKTRPAMRLVPRRVSPIVRGAMITVVLVGMAAFSVADQLRSMVG